MVEQITFQTIFQFLQTIGILVGVFYYVMTIRTNQKNQKLTLESRQTNILTNLHTFLVSEEYQTAFSKLERGWDEMKIPLDPTEFIERHGEPDGGGAIWVIFFRVCQFWNGIGALVESELADFEIIYKLWGHMASWVWHIVHPIIQYERNYFNQPKYFEWFEYLNNRITEHNKAKPY